MGYCPRDTTVARAQIGGPFINLSCFDVEKKKIDEKKRTDMIDEETEKKNEQRRCF